MCSCQLSAVNDTAFDFKSTLGDIESGDSLNNQLPDVKSQSTLPIHSGCSAAMRITKGVHEATPSTTTIKASLRTYEQVLDSTDRSKTPRWTVSYDRRSLDLPSLLREAARA